MINLRFNPVFCSQSTVSEKEQPKNTLKLTAPLNRDTVCFTGKNKNKKNAKQAKCNERNIKNAWATWDSIETKENWDKKTGKEIVNTYNSEFCMAHRERCRIKEAEARAQAEIEEQAEKIKPKKADLDTAPPTLTPIAPKKISYGKISKGFVSDMEYKNVLKKTLASEPRPTFEEDLKQVDGIISYDQAKTRISSLSRYLKEDMVGFVVPEYITNNEKKGGYQWFEQSAEYLLRGSAEGETYKVEEKILNNGIEQLVEKTVKPGVAEADFQPAAKELYGLLAVHDNYWKSPEFVKYLSTLKQTPAIKATISAVKELGEPKDVSFTGEKFIKMYGYFSPLKAMDKLLDDGCAYSAAPLQFDDPQTEHEKINPKVNASLEHIMPKYWGGPCDDSNYLLASSKANSDRRDMALIQYLKGG